MKLSPALGAAFFASTFLCLADAPPDGAALFTMNCSACHQLDTMLVGPSLVEIRSLYLDKPADFVKWAVAPGRKRPGAIEMPSMVHIGEPGLRAIHAYIMSISKDVKAQKAVVGDPFVASPTQTKRPLVQRIFLPNASPAAIAVALDDQTSLCWDAGSCRLRYAWTGGFIDGYPYWKGNGSSQAKIAGTLRYSEAGSLFKGAPKFSGYEIKNGLPIFHYSLGASQITETFEAISGGLGFKRHFTSTPALPELIVLPGLTAGSKTKVTSDEGKEVNDSLIIDPDHAAKFTLTYTFQ